MKGQKIMHCRIKAQNRCRDKPNQRKQIHNSTKAFGSDVSVLYFFLDGTLSQFIE